MKKLPRFGVAIYSRLSEIGEVTFKIWNLYERIYKFQNSKYEVLFLDPHFPNISAIRFAL
jgi:hypothetical protein